jgi:hypothetical protein
MMNINRHTRDLVIRVTVLCAALGAATPTFAASAPNLPPEHHVGIVSYRSGGVGDDEAKAMQEIARQYPLELEFVAHEGNGHAAFLADVDVAIRDGGGNLVLQTTTDGPFLLARMPAGRYLVTAKYDNAQRIRHISVPAHGGRRVVFGW